MLLGEHEHSLDDKNRLTLPAKLRAAFEDGVVVSRGLDGCLYAYPRAEWERLAQRLAERDDLGEDARSMRRYFFSGASQGELDRQGRLVLSPPQIAHAGLEREVTITGVHDHLEIWDRTKWRQQLHELEGSAEDVAERLAN
jgi:MraZ protein